MLDYNSLLSERIKNIKPSGIRRFFDIAAEMEGVISLGVGEPDFKTPWNIREAGIQSLKLSKTWYTANAGLFELKEEISKYIERKTGLYYDPKTEVMVTVGGSEGIDICIRALIENGDEVLVTEPSFVSYAPIAELAGGVSVPLATRVEDGFKLTPETLSAHLSERAKLLVLPFPSNPTGAVMDRDDLEKIAALVRGRNMLVLSDEIYSELTYTKQPHVSIAGLPGMKERTVMINGFSKAFAMTGWRLGYACGPAPIISQMLKVHQFAIMCAPTTSQYAGVVALREGEESTLKMKAEYDMRRRLIVDSLRRIGLDCFEPQGAFYVFPSIKKTGLTSEEFCERLLYAEKVAVIPGSAFGESGEGYVRISYSYSVNYILEAVKRIERFLKTL